MAKHTQPLEYTCDAENRLTDVTPILPQCDYEEEMYLICTKKVKLDYDHQNRRVRKRVISWTGSAWNESSQDEDWRFVYDGWNVVLVLDGMDGEDEGTDPDHTTVRKYTWGLDLSGLGDGRSCCMRAASWRRSGWGKAKDLLNASTEGLRPVLGGNLGFCHWTS